jgi:hypothetical protein
VGEPAGARPGEGGQRDDPVGPRADVAAHVDERVAVQPQHAHAVVHRDPPLRERGADRMPGVAAQHGGRRGLRGEDGELDLETEEARALGGEQRELVERQRPGGPARDDEGDAPGAAGLQVADHGLHRGHVPGAAEGQGPVQRGVRLGAHGDQQRVVGQLGAGARQHRGVLAAHGAQRVVHAARAEVVGDRAEVVLRRRPAPEGGRDRVGAEGERGARVEEGDVDAVAREGVQSGERLQAGDARARDDDAVTIVGCTAGHAPDGRGARVLRHRVNAARPTVVAPDAARPHGVRWFLRRSLEPIPPTVGSVRLARRLPDGPRELLIFACAYLTYFGVRAFTEGAVPEAMANADRVAHVERVLGLNWERGIQEAVLRHAWLVDAMNAVYVYGHWPVLIIGGVLLFRYRRAHYYHLRDAIVVTGVIGLFVFALFPVAPPRLSGHAIVDTVTRELGGYRQILPRSLVNEYAAMPSFHAGWNLLLGVVVFRATRQPFLRFLAVAGPAAMITAVVATANHFVVDVLAGVAMVLAGLVLLHITDGLRARRTLAEQDEQGAVGRGAPGGERSLPARSGAPGGHSAGGGGRQALPLAAGGPAPQDDRSAAGPLGPQGAPRSVDAGHGAGACAAPLGGRGRR